MIHRNTRRLASTTTFCLFTIAAISFASAQNLVPPPDAKTRVDKVFSRFNRTDSPGCAVGAAINGQTVLSAAYGMADLEHGLALTPETIFEPGSVSKQFTAAAVLLLAQQGKLSIDDPVRKYIPELPDYGTPITIRHLLTHTSGLRDWGSVEDIAGWPRTTRVYTLAHVLDIAAHQHALNYPPGAEYSYTNTGFNLAAILVNRVADKPLPEFTRDEIFTPLGMGSTSWRDDFRRIVRNRAIAYSQTGNTILMDMPFEDVYGNSSLLTTVGDLLRWNQNFTDRKVGGSAFIQAQQQQGRLTDGRTIAYAAGGLMVLNWMGLPEVSHSGSTAGYRGWLARYPEQGLSIAMLCNTTAANPEQLGHEVAEVYLASVIQQHPPAPVAVSISSLESKAGLYRSVRNHGTLSIDLRDGQLEIQGRGVLKPISEDAFTLGAATRAEFDVDAHTRAFRLRLATQLDQSDYYEKVEPANPSRADLQEMTGEYYSDEAEVALKVTLEPNGLVIHRRPDATIPLTPTYRDGFKSSLGSVRFLRDPGGRVTELSIGEARVWDIRFHRVPEHGSLPVANSTGTRPNR